MDETLARQDSWMHRMDPCVRLITVVIVSFSAALCHDVKILGGHLLMSLVLAGLAAKSKTSISRIYHLERGYENLEEKFQKLGARMWREKE